MINSLTSAVMNTATVDFITQASAEVVWQALTESSKLAQWFASSTSSLNTGSSTCFDFGDGDFFTVTEIHGDRPNFLRYDWRFLGIGAINRIMWQLLPQEHGTLVRVSDWESERSPAATLEMQAGWLDFTNRLSQFLETGCVTRYDWRREIDGSIELPGDRQTVWEVLFAPENQARWLPLEVFPHHHSLSLTLENGSQIAGSQVANLIWHPETDVCFHLSHPQYSNSTRAHLELIAGQHNTKLVISHVGWEDIHSDSDRQLEQRRKFCRVWIEALQLAQQLIHSQTKVL